VSRAYIGMGSNVGDRLENLKAAAMSLSAAMPEMVLIARSVVYGSEPVGMTDQPDFLNAVMAVETTLEARSLLSFLHQIEIDMGRQRITRWGPRTLDLDILMYGDEQSDNEDLTLPHPRLVERRFALEPLLEIEPRATLPDCTPLSALLEKLGDEQAAWRVGEL